tara:strand:- start:20 stop:343 length:324 start_codon:yes stop_codon:yes gene_type:complete
VSDSVNTISVSDLNEKISHLSEKECIIDVRSDDEYHAAHIEPSNHIPLDQLDEHLESLQDYDTLYFFCRSGNRSGKACQLLAPYLKATLYNVEGGILAWENEKLPIV